MSKKIINVANMMRKALNTLDHRLVDHGERVAYMMLKMSQADGSYTCEQLAKICYLSMFHDIGAYETERLDSLDSTSKNFKFEVVGTHRHAVYSYVFFKEHPFFDEFSDGVLYHHVTRDKLSTSDCVNKKLAGRMFMADKIDVMILNAMVKSPEDVFAVLDNPVFEPDDIALFIKTQEESGVLTKIFNGEYKQELLDFLAKNSAYEQHLHSLVQMIPHAIDFRSDSTVTHTAATVQISMILADLYNMSEDSKETLYLAALLHDVGKIATPLMILEKNTSLTAHEFEIMKDHVVLTEYILSGCVHDDIVRIASRHHEKLDGTGYPLGLVKDDLTFCERVVAVADILSALLGKRSYKEPFPKEKVVAIVSELSEKGKICSHCVSLALDNYDLLVQSVVKCSDDAMLRYEELQQTVAELNNRLAI